MIKFVSFRGRNKDLSPDILHLLTIKILIKMVNKSLSDTSICAIFRCFWILLWRPQRGRTWFDQDLLWNENTFASKSGTSQTWSWQKWVKYSPSYAQSCHSFSFPWWNVRPEAWGFEIYIDWSMLIGLISSILLNDKKWPYWSIVGNKDIGYLFIQVV